MNRRKMAFTEIGGGKLAAEVQCLFEQAQVDAMKRNAKVRVNLTIIVGPPETEDRNFGHVSFRTSTVVPPRESMQYTTELSEGVIVASGESEADLLQLKLDLPEPEETFRVIKNQR
jgi:hypothetical protein